ncbi:hypothetical protein D3C75_1069590 [compost metagenome]
MHRILCHQHGNLKLFSQKHVQSVKQSAAAGENNPAVDNIRRQLRRSALQHRLGRGHNGRHRFPEGFADFIGVDGNGQRKSGNHIPSPDIHLFIAVVAKHRGNAHLDIL